MIARSTYDDREIALRSRWCITPPKHFFRLHVLAGAVVGTAANVVAAFCAEDGRALWRIELPTTATIHAGDDERLWVSWRAPSGDAEILGCIDPMTGARLFQVELSIPVAGCSMRGDRLAVLLNEFPSRDAKVMIVGDQDAEKDELDCPVIGRVALFGDRILVGEHSNRLPSGRGLVALERGRVARTVLPLQAVELEASDSVIVATVVAESDAAWESLSNAAVEPLPTRPQKPKKGDRSEWIVLLGGPTLDVRWTAFARWGNRSHTSEGARQLVHGGFIVHVEERGRAQYLVRRDETGARLWTTELGFTRFDVLRAQGDRVIASARNERDEAVLVLLDSETGKRLAVAKMDFVEWAVGRTGPIVARRADGAIEAMEVVVAQIPATVLATMGELLRTASPAPPAEVLHAFACQLADQILESSPISRFERAERIVVECLSSKRGWLSGKTSAAALRRALAKLDRAARSLRDDAERLRDSDDVDLEDLRVAADNLGLLRDLLDPDPAVAVAPADRVTEKIGVERLLAQLFLTTEALRVVPWEPCRREILRAIADAPGASESASRVEDAELWLEPLARAADSEVSECARRALERIRVERGGRSMLRR